MKTKERKTIGYIGVDAGLCWIGDPCYILHTDTPSKDIGKDWDEFCDKFEGLYRQFNYDGNHAGLGVCCSTGYGDGFYPVIAEFEDGRVARVTVDFMPEDEDSDEYDEEDVEEFLP